MCDFVCFCAVHLYVSLNDVMMYVKVYLPILACFVVVLDIIITVITNTTNK